MPLPEAVGAHYRAQQQLTKAITERARLVWRRIDPDNLAESWTTGLSDQVFVQVSAGQLLAATNADPYLDAVLTEQGISIDRSASIAPRAFAGIAVDGRSLDTLLLEPVIAVKEAIGKGASVADALTTGEVRLTQIVATQVTDAGRTAVGTGMVARPAVTTYTRYLNPPSCSRCTVLAGRVYRWSQGFSRHPLCDCSMTPSTEAASSGFVSNPRDYFDSLTADEQNKVFTIDGAQSIRDGADIGRVVNTRQRSGLAMAGEKRIGATTGRKPPELIFHGATDRNTAIADLKAAGYLA